MELLFYFLGIIAILNYLNWVGEWYVWVLIGLYFFMRFCLILGNIFINKIKQQQKINSIQQQLNLNKE